MPPPTMMTTINCWDGCGFASKLAHAESCKNTPSLINDTVDISGTRYNPTGMASTAQVLADRRHLRESAPFILLTQPLLSQGESPSFCFSFNFDWSNLLTTGCLHVTFGAKAEAALL